jgi:pimeloyl-ACP methyl ester carboxylesterase
MLSSTTDQVIDTAVPSRPSRGLFAAEVPRAMWEIAFLQSVRPLLAATPRGDGHPVVVLPGFTAGDGSTRFLRHFLRTRGYHVHAWRLGSNAGPTRRIVAGLEERFLQLSEQHGQRVSVVGWSLGGTYAREIAHDHPERVRHVVTLGTPHHLDSIDQVAAGPLFKALSGRFDPDAMTADDLGADREPLRVPSTSIYSRTDGFVPWQLCAAAEGPRQEHVEVGGSHLGLGFNPVALAIVADRLALPEDQWSPFSESKLARLVSATTRRPQRAS